LELEILKKKLSSYRTDKGRITRVSDELLGEILKAWEQWTGPASGFYTALGADHRKMASLIGRAKKLKRDGHFPEELFKEIKIAEPPVGIVSPVPGVIELALDGTKLIRFSGVPQLIEFLIQYSMYSLTEQSEVKKAG
jgi:hypothetical protein